MTAKQATSTCENNARFCSKLEMPPGPLRPQVQLPMCAFVALFERRDGTRKRGRGG
ncbi:hypothetical protein LEMLEM_LOCUS1793, partial [Lemmus lemmus]